jgi:hypothetical protein
MRRRNIMPVKLTEEDRLLKQAIADLHITVPIYYVDYREDKLILYLYGHHSPVEWTRPKPPEPEPEPEVQAEAKAEPEPEPKAEEKKAPAKKPARKKAAGD